MFIVKFLKNSLLNEVNFNRSLLITNSRNLQLFRRPNESKKDEDEVEEEPVKISLDDEENQNEEILSYRIARMRDKSRLNSQHKNILHDRVPYNQAESWIHETLKYKRMMFGRYGRKSGVDPRLCFYTNAELDEKAEYEKVAYPHSIQDMMVKNEEEKKYKRERVQKREENIAANIKKLEQWKFDLQNKVAKKEEEARVAKERKDRLIEEVRRHFGFSVHPKDERFKELLEKKEKEQRKALKEAKKQQKEAKLLSKIAESQVKKPENVRDDNVK